MMNTTELQNAIGIPDLTFDESNEGRVLLDGKIPVLFYFSPDDGVLITTVVIDAVDPRELDSHTGLFFEMLAGNYCWSLTGGGTLAIDEETGALVLSNRVSVAEGVPENLSDDLAALTTAGEYWIDRVARIHDDKSGASPSFPENDPAGIRI